MNCCPLACPGGLAVVENNLRSASRRGACSWRHLPALAAPAQLLTCPHIHRPSCRSGEVVVRGPSVFAGYYKAQVGGAGAVVVQHGRLFLSCHEPSLGARLFAFYWCLVGAWCPTVPACGVLLQDKTDEVLDKDGWFHTGEAAVVGGCCCASLFTARQLYRPAGPHNACCTVLCLLAGWPLPAAATPCQAVPLRQLELL